MNACYEHIVTGRHQSLFAGDIEANRRNLEESIRGSRIAVVGAAGSIGSAVVRSLLPFRPAALALIDLSENNLVELVRELRSAQGLLMPEDFTTLPLGIGSVEFDRYFAETKPFDYFLNLSAIKHVRSERNIYCLMRMIDTNVLFLHDFLTRNRYGFRKVFSVSSDKATNPANLMGATKMIMEKALLLRSSEQSFSTARFANVAFSDGSLPFGFLHRINKGQAISAPKDVRRYFISHQEAGELCVLSSMLGENREVFFPKLVEGQDEKTFAEIARDLLQAFGYTPVECASEDEARERAPALVPKRKWPCYFFGSDTTGEKEYEEFFTHSERVALDRFENIGVIQQNDLAAVDALLAFLDFSKKAKCDPNIRKEDYVREMLKVVPTLQHQETGKNLDQKM